MDSKRKLYSGKVVMADSLTTKDKIGEILFEKFSPSLLEVIDESADHAGHSGAIVGKQTHFKVRISSDKFRGFNKVQAHQQIYNSLETLMGNPIHALSIQICQ
jgi:BolA family transcriptional regulator, general stress-responsive regulator